MRKQWLVLLIAVLASAMLWGCGSSGGGGDEVSSSTEDLATAENVGNCTICHTLDVHSEISGIAGVNSNESGLGSSITHDCEACHGGGQYHRGQGPIPYPEPNAEQCVTCHDQATLVLASKHNGEDAENVEMLADGHDTRYCQRCHTAEGSIAFKDVIGDKGTVENGVPEPLENLDADGNHILHMPTCAACHNPLTKELQQFDTASWDPNQNGESDQLDMCTSCHNYKTADGSMLFGSGSTASGTAEFYHDTAWYRNITTTHYDNPATLSGQGNESDTVINKVEGYVIRENSDNPCFDCHGHELLTNTSDADDPEASTIHTQWAQSGHAAKILTQAFEAATSVDCEDIDGLGTASDSLSRGRCDEQTDAAMLAYASDSTGAGWTHYDWDAGNRQSCQMCHTATGASNFLNDQDGYDPADNDFSHLSGWSMADDGTVTSSAQNEVLYCWGCHSDAESGELNNPGSVTLAYTADAAEIVIPDMGNSNVCINCHSGRGNMDSLLSTADADPSGAAVTGGTRTHYLAAGGTIFQSLTKIGYEYAGQSYTDKSYFAHNSLGCAECHMASEQSHSYEVVTKDETSGAITAINSTLCVSCHDGEHALFVSAEQVGETANIWNGSEAAATTVTQDMADEAAEELELEAEGYHNALEALAAALTSAGTTPISSYPYFSGTSTDQGHGGAMHNYSYLHHEPGAYAHNRYYAKRLIFDSIDWLTSGDAGSRALDGSITLDTTTYAEAIAWLGGDADTGVVATRPGD